MWTFHLDGHLTEKTYPYNQHLDKGKFGSANIHINAHVGTRFPGWKNLARKNAVNVEVEEGGKRRRSDRDERANAKQTVAATLRQN